GSWPSRWGSWSPARTSAWSFACWWCRTGRSWNGTRRRAPSSWGWRRSPVADIETVLHEARVFPPPEGFAQAAHIPSLGEYRGLYEWSLRDPEGFWAQQAEVLRWSRRWEKVLEWEPPFAKWV